MRAEVKKHGDVMIINIAGTLHIEETQPFREICKKRFTGEKVVFNMSGASFVGSTGLQSFMDAVRGLDESGAYGLKLVGLKPEFKRLFASVENARFQYFEDVRTAVGAFVNPVGAITFQNPVAVKLIGD
jgi:anti-anti-sigma factor